MRHSWRNHHTHHPQHGDQCPDCPAGRFPLSMAHCDQCVRLVGIEGGRTLRKRLCEMGLNPGCELRVVHASGGGPLILAVKEDTRLALGRGMAHRILVENKD